MPRENKTRFAVLAMLSLGPRSGYDIQQQIQRTLGHFWSESHGQIYPTLRKLLAEGLATARTEPGTGSHGYARRSFYGSACDPFPMLYEVAHQEPPPAKTEETTVTWATLCSTASL